MENINAISKKIISFLDRISQQHKDSLFSKEDSGNYDFHIYYINYYYPDDSMIEKVAIIVPDPKTNLDAIRINKIIGYYKRKFDHTLFVDYKKFFKNKKSNVIDENQLFNFLLSINKYYDKFLKNDSDVVKINNGSYIKRGFNIINSIDFHETSSSFINSVMGIWLKKRGTSPILLIGNRGIGKTYSLKSLCIEINRKHNTNPWIEPAAIYINLGDMKSHPLKSASLFKYILEINSNINTIYSLGSSFQYNIWESFLKTSKVILLLDGFDEIKEENTKSLMSYYINEITSLVSDYPKTIIASRSNHFDSIEHIKRLFTINPDFNIEDDKANFNIIHLDTLNTEEYSKLDKVTFSDNESFDSLISKRIINTTAKNDVTELSYIPAFYDVIINLLKNTKLSGIEIIENSVLKAVIEFNVDNQRSVHFINSIINDEKDFLPFQATEKFELIKDFSWFLFERGHEKDFPISKLNEFISLRYDNQDTEVLVNDVKTQTVFSIQKNNNKLRFLTNGLYNFFISKYIYKLLCDVETLKKGIEILGRYDFTSNKVGIYLKEMLISEAQTYDKLKKQIDNFDLLIESNLRFLDNNLIYLSLQEGATNQGMFWKDINSVVKEHKFTNDHFLFIKSSIKSIPSFFLKKTEVTNEEFAKFLSDKDSKLKPELWKRSAVYIKGDKNIFKSGYNDYYLLYWKNDEIPLGFEDHPLVYVSWFAAANYCNWLSEKDGLPSYYDFDDSNIPNKKMEIRRNTGSAGYRLPTKDEWNFVARDGNYEIDYPWEKYRINNSNKLNDFGIKYKHDLLNNKVNSLPVMNDIPNEFGIYGQIGNVREWVDKNPESNDRSIGITVKMPIKGATWLLGERGFAFEHVAYIYSENTNFDVGFRVARSLLSEELNILKKYKI